MVVNVYFLFSFPKAGVLPPHPHSLVVAAKNREALATSTLTSDVLEEVEKDEEAVEEIEENRENEEGKENVGSKENEEDKKDA